MALVVRHRFRVEALGALHPELRLELLDGEVYEMAPPSSEHAGLLDWRAQLRVQSPLRDPEGGRFRQGFLVAKGEAIAPLLLPQAELLFQPPL